MDVQQKGHRVQSQLCHLVCVSLTKELTLQGSVPSNLKMGKGAREDPKRYDRCETSYKLLGIPGKWVIKHCVFGLLVKLNFPVL